MSKISPTAKRVTVLFDEEFQNEIGSPLSMAFSDNVKENFGEQLNLLMTGLMSRIRIARIAVAEKKITKQAFNKFVQAILDDIKGNL